MALLRSAVVALSLCAGASGFLLAPPTANANNRSPVLRHGTTTTAAVRPLLLGRRTVCNAMGWARGLGLDRRASSQRGRTVSGRTPGPKSTEALPSPTHTTQQTAAAAALVDL